MKIEILTLFPGMFEGPFGESIIKRALEKGLAEIASHDLRKWGEGERRNVDDRPYGGGPGMILKIEPITEAIVVGACFSIRLFDEASRQQFLR